MQVSRALPECSLATGWRFRACRLLSNVLKCWGFRARRRISWVLWPRRVGRREVAASEAVPLWLVWGGFSGVAEPTVSTAPIV